MKTINIIAIGLYCLFCYEIANTVADSTYVPAYMVGPLGAWTMIGLLAVGLALVLWPHRSELASIVAFFWLCFCGKWRLSPLAVASIALVYAACFFFDYADPTLKQFAVWRWDKLAWWALFTGLSCAALNSVVDHNQRPQNTLV